MNQMQGIEVGGVEADDGSSSASSFATDSFNAGQYALGKEKHDGLELGCLEVNGAHVNGGGFGWQEDWLYHLCTVRAEDQRLLKIYDAKHAYKMSLDAKYMSDKGKRDVVEQSSGLFIREPSNKLVAVLPTSSTFTVLGSGERIETSPESHITLQGPSSISKHIVSNANVTHDKNLRRRNRDKARRDRLTTEQREEMNAGRRAARRNKTYEERNASQRAARKKLTPEERQLMNARRRTADKSKPVEERQEMNARRRARRQSIPLEERQALRIQRNAYLAAKRNTPCAESIAMPCPGAHLF